MGFDCGQSALEYPDQYVLKHEWEKHISPWLSDTLTNVASKSREEACSVFNTALVDNLLGEDDSAQKVFDLYGAAQFFKSVNLKDRYKELLIEVSRLMPYSAIYIEISAVCAALNNVSERLKYLEMAYEQTPEYSEILNAIGMSLMSLDQKVRGLELMRKSAEEIPTDRNVYSSYLYSSHQVEELDCQKIFDDHRQWARIQANNDYITDHKNDSDPDRKLRIGYISPDFRVHPVGIIINSIVEMHDRDKYEVFGYSNVQERDGLTEVLERKFDTCRAITGRSSEDTVNMILEDKIDILVDLSGHTGYNRLDVMAYKPAPVQVSYLGYFETTGMEQIDYFLTDGHISPPGSQKYHTEELFCLPDTCLSFNGQPNAPGVVPSPFLKNGYVTFGMFSNTPKITRKTARLWSRILENTKRSRLKMILRCGGSEETLSIYSNLLKECGVPLDRIDIQKEVFLADYFKAYNEVDIMLDTYPYNGGMTTCDAFWMGVPIISLVGEHHFSRVGLSLLSSVGLDYFAAKTEDEYVKKASMLAAMPDSLSKIRFGLRRTMSRSPLGNSRIQTKNIENAYRSMWHRWCGEKQL